MPSAWPSPPGLTRPVHLPHPGPPAVVLVPWRPLDGPPVHSEWCIPYLQPPDLSCALCPGLSLTELPRVSRTGRALISGLATCCFFSLFHLFAQSAPCRDSVQGHLLQEACPTTRVPATPCGPLRDCTLLELFPSSLHQGSFCWLGSRVQVQRCHYSRAFSSGGVGGRDHGVKAGCLHPRDPVASRVWFSLGFRLF